MLKIIITDDVGGLKCKDLLIFDDWLLGETALKIFVRKMRITRTLFLVYDRFFLLARIRRFDCCLQRTVHL